MSFGLCCHPTDTQVLISRVVRVRSADYHDKSVTHLNLQNQKPTVSTVLSQAVAAGVVQRAALVQDLALVDITHGFEQHL
ncbi:hypothetical protein AMELA_G00044000 [Ameiurus melas]|uniref:Uncharacterized protein n=1 Tax=Ameiurus melas TaxID=219545 RepID=A0A7J6B789_AMEME|nr:hypothetical protein AMELA_G00044000 [Ameiurus melas]